MKFIIDDKIPYIKGYAEKLGETIYKAGAEITSADVKDVDAMIIRTRTHCNKSLLQGSKVKFIATATIGYDHIDTQYLKEVGITWTNCPGCNANSVAQYIESCLLLLSAHGCWSKKHLSAVTSPIEHLDNDFITTFKKLTLGIVGVGNVGKAVLNTAKRMGFKNILLCDPPRAIKENNKLFATIDDIAQKADIITFHTPLTFSDQSPYPTYHLANDHFFSLLKPTAVIINSSRGEVVDTKALKYALSNHLIQTAIIDTWEQEPNIDVELLHQLFIGTPHIAGYSADGKANGTRMSLQALAKFFNKDTAFIKNIVPPTLPINFKYCTECENWKISNKLKLYDPTHDYLELLNNPQNFELIRGNYPLRREHLKE